MPLGVAVELGVCEAERVPLTLGVPVALEVDACEVVCDALGVAVPLRLRVTLRL